MQDRGFSYKVNRLIYHIITWSSVVSVLLLAFIAFVIFTASNQPFNKYIPPGASEVISTEHHWWTGSLQISTNEPKSAIQGLLYSSYPTVDNTTTSFGSSLNYQLNSKSIVTTNIYLIAFSTVTVSWETTSGICFYFTTDPNGYKHASQTLGKVNGTSGNFTFTVSSTQTYYAIYQNFISEQLNLDTTVHVHMTQYNSSIAYGMCNATNQNNYTCTLDLPFGHQDSYVVVSSLLPFNSGFFNSSNTVSITAKPGLRIFTAGEVLFLFLGLILIFIFIGIQVFGYYFKVGPYSCFGRTRKIVSSEDNYSQMQ